MRLGLPFDRPLLRIANALDFSMMKDGSGNNSKRKGNCLVSNRKHSAWFAVGVYLSCFPLLFLTYSVFYVLTLTYFYDNIRAFFAQRCTYRDSK